jgi:hypothetical protein
MNPTIELSKRTFWDVDLTEDDLNTQSEWIINRVFDRGTMEEVFWVINYYGFGFVKKTITTTTENLPRHAILLARAIFQISNSDFKCLEGTRFQHHF